MKKYLMKGFAAIVFCGAIASCSRDMESSSGSATEKIEETYSKAFVTHFAQPAQDQTWGFGNAAAGTRANNPAQTFRTQVKLSMPIPTSGQTPRQARLMAAGLCPRL